MSGCKFFGVVFFLVGLLSSGIGYLSIITSINSAPIIVVAGESCIFVMPGILLMILGRLFIIDNIIVIDSVSGMKGEPLNEW